MSHRHYDARVASALTDPRIARLIAGETGAHPNLAGHIALGLATTAALEGHAATPHGGEAGPHTHAELAPAADVAVLESELDAHVGEPHADPAHDHVGEYEPSGSVAAHAATPHGGDVHDHDADYEATGAVASHEAAAHAALATDAELAAHAGTEHGLSSHAIDGAYHTGAEVLPTTGQKNALAGTSGTPGSGNPYVTDQDARLADARTPTAHDHDADVDAAIAAHTSAEPHGVDGEAFPVGSVFLSVVATDPATLLGYGTWQAIAAGRMLVGLDAGDAAFDAAEETGGAKTHTHAAHTGIISHTHPVTDPGHVHDEYNNAATTGPNVGWGAQDTSTNNASLTGYDTGSAQSGVSVGAPGGAVASYTHDAPSHLPPYFVVHVWKRTA